MKQQMIECPAGNNTYPKGGISDCVWINCIYFIVLHLITIAATVPPFG